MPEPKVLNGTNLVRTKHNKSTIFNTKFAFFDADLMDILVEKLMLFNIYYYYYIIFREVGYQNAGAEKTSVWNSRKYDVRLILVRKDF